MHQLRIDFDAPPPAALDPDAEVDRLIAELQAIETHATLTDGDRAALARIGLRADALGYINLGTRADMLLALEGYA